MSTTLTLRSELPWLRPAQMRLQAAASRDRLPHALLVHGSNGGGAAWFARWAAALALCEARAAAPCGQCRACQRVEMLQHPDFRWLAPLEDSREIRIDQIRELGEDLALTSHGGGRKVAVLAPAERLNRNAANALLKTLEEPSGHAMLILVAAQPGRVAATLRSRCQRIDLAKPAAPEAATWLKSMGASEEAISLLGLGALEPLDLLGIDAANAMSISRETRATLDAASDGALDVVATADRWSRADYDWRLVCIETWLTNCARRAATARQSSANMGAGAHLPVGRPALNIRSLFELLDGVRELRRLADAPLNKSLALERLLWRVTSLTGRKMAGA